MWKNQTLTRIIQQITHIKQTKTPQSIPVFNPVLTQPQGNIRLKRVITYAKKHIVATINKREKVINQVTQTKSRQEKSIIPTNESWSHQKCLSNFFEWNLCNFLYKL